MPWTVLDLFSGGGGMSFGFHAHHGFEVVGAVDAENGKPSSPKGSLGCNATYALNMGIEPMALDLSAVESRDIAQVTRRTLGFRPLDVLSACPPCTGFSRANPKNHVEDDARNSLVARMAHWIAALRPRVVVMENARELLRGRFAHHHASLLDSISADYSVHSAVHMLSDYGLPQKRERALILAVRRPLELHTLQDLWDGWSLDPFALTVRHAIEHLPAVPAGTAHASDRFHVSPAMTEPLVERLRATPHSGGSWRNLLDHPDADRLLTPAMKRSAAAGKLGSHPDVYGRMAWDQPAATIKRECGHVGNGRYAHPEQDRLCTVRELGLLNGFPSHYQFGGQSLSNMYRHIGDAVPPLISHQLAWVAAWILSGARPSLEQCLLPGTSLRSTDLRPRGLATG
ncbi:MAG: DNA (cytosine-5-)-methyltransferase [Deltaproteobacteria bacterium]|nr:DNA (cytosine-5-)-methyltransferase [Deltaproteobacteria bacterium]HCH64977.1 DNA cytosine methyltransferase [Deltaproteobacteria bacterium]